MNSGNYIIGDDLSIDGFEKYLKPKLKENGYSVTNAISIQEDNQKRVLIAIKGDGDIEETLNNNLKEVYNALNEKGPLDFSALPINFQVCKVIGTYSAEDTASQLFPAIAQEYLVLKAEKAIDSLEESIKSLLKTQVGDL